MRYTYTPLEDFVNNLYHKLSIFVPTDINMIDIAQKLNIILHFYDDGSTAMCSKGVCRIFIDNRITQQEQWQDFGHELCHVLRHEGTQIGMSRPFLYLQESQAENFMYQFCVPTFMLLKYQIADYLSIKDGITFISNVFNVTDQFAERRLVHFRNQILRSKSDYEHRRQMEAIYPKAPPYSDETNVILKKLYRQLEKKGVNHNAPATTIS